MKPATLDLPIIWRGCDWPPIILKWKDQNGDPINLSGWVPRALSVNVNLNASIVDVGQGITQMTLTRIQTASLKLGSEKWDWIWERIAGQYRWPPFLSGTVIIKDPVSDLTAQLNIPSPPPIPVPPPLPG